MVEIKFKICVHIVTDLINALPGNSSVNTGQDATIEESVFSVSAVMPQQWIGVYCRSVSVPRLYNESREL
jgi:hypothetical protein